MKEGAAGGDGSGMSVRMRQALEDEVAALAKGVIDCLQTAHAASPEELSGTSRADERRDARLFVEATAELLRAIAKVNGEFHHNYHVRRIEESAPPSPEAMRKNFELIEAGNLRAQHEVDAMSDEDYVDYKRSLSGLPPKYAGRKCQAPPGKYGAHEEALGHGRDLDREGRPIPPTPTENRGSNAGP